MARTSMMMRLRGERSMMSSMAPIYNIMLMARTMGRTSPQSIRLQPTSVPHKTPKNTAIPPITGMGRF